MSEKISKYGYPMEYTACPGCGQQYGHRNTKVDRNSQECSICTKDKKNEEVDLVDAALYLIEILK